MSEMKPICVDLPYPSMDDIIVDIKSANIISPQYASLESELTAILQYIYHSHYFDMFNLKKYASMLESIAMSEMRHFDILGTLLLKLGVDPVYTMKPPYKQNFFNSSKVAYSNKPEAMFLDSIRSEMGAIRGYEYIVEQLSNEDVANVIRRILLDENLHLKVLNDALKEYNLQIAQTKQEEKIRLAEERKPL